MATNTLGRGLGSLIPQDTKKSIGKAPDPLPESSESIRQVPIDAIQPNPHQPRQQFDHESFEELTRSIREHGIIQPIVLVAVDDGFQLIAGERRLRAAKVLNMKTVPAVLRTVTEQEKLELALIENMQREDLNPIERAHGYQQLMDEFSMTQEQVSEQVGPSRATIANALRLLTLSSEMQDALVDGSITEGHAKALLAIEDEKERDRLFRDVVKGELTVRDVEKKARKTSRRKQKTSAADPNTQALEDELQESLGTRVRISRKGQRGSISIQFYSLAELKEIIRKITR